MSPASIYPGIIKLASSGYDGKGQQIVENKSEALAAFNQFNSQPCVLEKIGPGLRSFGCSGPG